MDASEGTVSSTIDQPARQPRRGRGERGTNLVEYCLLVVLILLAALAGVTQFGRAVPTDSFQSVHQAL